MISDKIIELEKKLVESANLVEKMLKKSLNGYKNKDLTLLKEVIEKDEEIENQYEYEIELLGTRGIMNHEFEEKELRVIVMALKINNDLERIGDIAVNIAESAIELLKNKEVPESFCKTIVEYGDMVRSMLVGSIDSFISGDSKLAYEILKKDDIIDNLKVSLLKRFLNPDIYKEQDLEEVYNIIRIIHGLERVGDLATNICEDVIFIVEDKLIKHKKGEML